MKNESNGLQKNKIADVLNDNAGRNSQEWGLGLETAQKNESMDKYTNLIGN